MQSKYGRQPAREIMRDRKLMMTRTAREIGVTFLHLNHAILGRYRPNDLVRQRLPIITGVPLEELFTEDILSKPFNNKIPEGRKRNDTRTS